MREGVAAVLPSARFSAGTLTESRNDGKVVELRSV